MVSVTIRNLSKSYGKTVAVKDVSLEVRDREFFVLLGPSGCGKTTLLLCIAGLLKPEKGEIWFGDELVTSAERKVYVPPQKRGVAMVFQDYALYPHMTVFENILFPLEIAGLSKQLARERVMEVANLLGLEKLLDRKPRQLSGGQKQRVALARAIVREPAVFLMDEPLANLDAKLRTHTRVELKKLQQRLGVTTIYVTHDQVEAMSMADRVAVMSAGVLQQVGTPVEIYERPKNVFVAGFIGSPPMNMFDGSVKEVNGHLAVDLGFSTFKLPEWMGKAIRKSNAKEVILGIRPQHVVFTGKDQENAFRMKVTHIEIFGRELHVHLSADDKRLVLVTNPEHKVKPDEEVWVTFSRDRFYLFDRKTKRSLV